MQRLATFDIWARSAKPSEVSEPMHSSLSLIVNDVALLLLVIQLVWMAKKAKNWRAQLLWLKLVQSKLRDSDKQLKNKGEKLQSWCSIRANSAIEAKSARISSKILLFSLVSQSFIQSSNQAAERCIHFPLFRVLQAG